MISLTKAVERVNTAFLPALCILDTKVVTKQNGEDTSELRDAYLIITRYFIILQDKVPFFPFMQ